ncbi:MAG: hypothetical protein A2Z20_00370 [Bdellovibrionales bacterium RBG_16_40_8]|nr:MAG: hypothetical protein A2Z20_00370 [Bdellovibrionales bacterium RBG_16_40_8]
MSFSFEIESTPKCEIVFMRGTIDESVNFKIIKPKNEAQLILDLKGINRLNSLGLRNWVQWMRFLNPHAGIVLRNCPNVVVHQINILDGFLPEHSIIESIEIPYTCDGCGHQTTYLAVRGRDYFEATADKAEQVSLPLQRKCVSCGDQAEADIMVAKHFRFLRRRLKP